MSTIHEFPKNYERFIAQGEEALVEHNQIAALENFQQAYHLQQTPPVNQKIVQLLLEMGEADEALALAEAFQESYLRTLKQRQFICKFIVKVVALLKGIFY